MEADARGHDELTQDTLEKTNQRGRRMYGDLAMLGSHCER
jgi:hypothetical protein